MNNEAITQHIVLRWDLEDKCLIVATSTEEFSLTPSEAIIILEMLDQNRESIVAALNELKERQ
jgi:hypothetical protein